MNLAASRHQQPQHILNSGQHQAFSNGDRGSRKKKERPKHNGSAQLTDAENEQLFGILGQDRISLCAGVAQLLVAQSPENSTWRKVNVGVVVLIKDYFNRNYALAMYDIFKQAPLWNQILYVTLEEIF